MLFVILFLGIIKIEICTSIQLKKKIPNFGKFLKEKSLIETPLKI